MQLSSRKNLFIVRSAPVVTHSRKRGGVGPLFKVKINEVLHCGTSLGVTHIFHCSKPRKWSRPPVWKANILSDKRPLPTSDIYTSRSILTIQAIHRTFSKIGFIAVSQMSNICGVSAGEIPIWTLRQLFAGFIGRFPSHRNVEKTKKVGSASFGKLRGGEGWKRLLLCFYDADCWKYPLCQSLYPHFK